MAKTDPETVRRQFAELVNMSAAELTEWLASDDSWKVGWKGKDGERKESIGHASGRRIVTLLATSEADFTAADEAHMRKVVGFIRRHSAQRPENIFTSRWRYSLMNWVHDPVKAEQ